MNIRTQCVIKTNRIIRYNVIKSLICGVITALFNNTHNQDLQNTMAAPPAAAHYPPSELHTVKAII